MTGAAVGTAIGSTGIAFFWALPKLATRLELPWHRAYPYALVGRVFLASAFAAFVATRTSTWLLRPYDMAELVAAGTALGLTSILFAGGFPLFGQFLCPKEMQLLFDTCRQIALRRVRRRSNPDH